MYELQATLEFSVELNRFYNVDLFQRGYYQIRVALKTPPKFPAKIEVSLPRNSETPYIVPACLLHGVAASKTFQILYRNEEININDAILYRLHTLVESDKAEECLERMEFQIVIELWFGDEEQGVQVTDKLECVSQRVLLVHFSPTKGLHHHVPVMFDYFHLCCTEVTIHATLIALHQPYISMLNRRPTSGRGVEQSTLENIYFGNRPLSETASKFFQRSRLRDACQVHRCICRILLSAFESLQSSFEMYLSKMTPPPNLTIEHTDCHKRLETMIANLQIFDDEDDFLQTAITDVTQLCAENVILWTQFLDCVTMQEKVLRHLAHEHHSLRVKRLAEAFFTFEYPKQEVVTCYEPSIHGHSDLATVVRNSAYYQSLPPLPVECTEVDGDSTSLPIIFEDIYTDHFDSSETVPEKNKSHRESSRSDSTFLSPKDKSFRSDCSSSHSGDSPNFGSKGKKKFIKNIKPEAFKRPSTTYNINAAEAGPVSKKDVVLVGYRKVQPAESVPRIEPVELGTFRPHMASILDELDLPDRGLAVSSSMPSLLVRSCWSRASSNSMPEMEPGNSPTRTRRGHSEGSPGRSNSSPRRSSASKILAQRLHENQKGGSLTDGRDVGNTAHRHSMFEPISQNLLTHFESNSGTDTRATELSSLHIHNTSVLSSVDSGTDSLSCDISAIQDDKRDYNNLAKGITEALGDVEEEERRSNMSDSATSSDSNIVLDKLINGEVIDDSCLNLDIDSGISDSVNRSGGDLSESGISKGDTTNSSFQSLNDPEKTIVPHSISDSSILNTTTESRLLSDSTSGSDEKLTLIELLKEEYVKSQQDASLSDGAVEDTLIHKRQKSIKQTQKCSSDTNLHGRGEVDRTTATAGTSLNNIANPSRAKSGHMTLSISSSTPELSKYENDGPKLVCSVANQTISFVTVKEELKRKLQFQGQLYSDFSTLASPEPYFTVPVGFEDEQDGVHLIVCVHGLDGNSADLRLIKTYLEMSLPGYKLEFLMSERNQDTFSDFETMTDRLVKEVVSHIEMFSLQPSRISFVGHSLGNIIIRSALSRPELSPFISKLYTFVSLSGPHLGTLYNNSGLVNMGMWFMQKWKKSGSLLQLSLKDHTDPRQTFLYKLSMKPGLELFRNVLLVGSAQDRYVPFHSSRIEVCRPAQRDNSTLGAVYCEMVENIMRPVIHNRRTILVRYDVFHALPSTANTIIGRAAHIAVLDSELFIEKFLTVSGLKYFR